MISALPLTAATRKRVNSWGHSPNVAPQKMHTCGLYSTSKQSHMKVGSKTQHLGMGFIKTLINRPSFELGLMVGAKQAFLSVTPPNDFQAYSFNKAVNFVRSDMSETFLSVIGYFLMM